MARVVAVARVLFALLIVAIGVPLSQASAADWADPAMERVWHRTDRPVADGVVARTWMWGPEPLFARLETYGSSFETRQVQYFDKSRMEINNPYAPKDDPWYVTNGLLVKELISGQMQVGDSQFAPYQPAQVPVAGDPSGNPGPTYASLASVASISNEKRAADKTGQAITASIDAQGNAGDHPELGKYSSNAYYSPELGHNVAGVFWDFLNSTGPVFGESGTVNGKLFDPTFYATGLPITEPYWSVVSVAGVQKWVLLQAFERRVLTYTPDNPDGWKVEMGNVGRHYFTWRYTSSYAVGQTYNFSNPVGRSSSDNSWQVTVLGVEKASRIDATTSYGTEYHVAAKGVFAIVRVRVKNIGQKPAHISSLDFMIRDVLWRQFDMSDNFDAHLAAKAKYGLNTIGTTVQPGLSDEEVYVFDIASEAEELRFTPDTIEQPTVNLGL